MTIDELYRIIKNRQQKMPEGSYTASLFKAGQDRIIQKVGEEATEVIISAKNKDKKKVISEISDLLFHVLVMIASLDISPDDIFIELDRRRETRTK